MPTVRPRPWRKESTVVPTPYPELNAVLQELVQGVQAALGNSFFSKEGPERLFATRPATLVSRAWQPLPRAVGALQYGGRAVGGAGAWSCVGRAESSHAGRSDTRRDVASRDSGDHPFLAFALALTLGDVSRLWWALVTLLVGVLLWNRLT